MELDQNITELQLLPLSPEKFTVTLHLVRHHIIPSETLKSFFYIALYRQSKHPNRGKHLQFEEFLKQLVVDALEILDQPAYSVVPDKTHCRNLLEQAKTLAVRLAEGHPDAYRNDTIEYDVLLTLFNWLPGNIVAGPLCRSNDSVYSLDAPLQSLGNDTDLIGEIYSEMRAYINEYQTSLPRIVDMLNTFVLSHKNMRQFNVDHWELKFNVRPREFR